MGCFSWKCDICKKGIKSSSFDGEPCRLTLLKKGKVLQVMEGRYDSYGRVFTDDHDGSIEWKLPWDEVCDLMFYEDKSSGIAAAHLNCIKLLSPKYKPKVQSADDPNQGWGDDMELLGGGRVNSKKELK